MVTVFFRLASNASSFVMRDRGGECDSMLRMRLDAQTGAKENTLDYYFSINPVPQKYDPHY
jgi:hypothetical protein